MKPVHGNGSVNDQPTPPAPKDPRVEAALREYLERVDRGEPVDREEFLARHAPIADAAAIVHRRRRRSAEAGWRPRLRLTVRTTPRSRLSGRARKPSCRNRPAKRAAESGGTGLDGPIRPLPDYPGSRQRGDGNGLSGRGHAARTAGRAQNAPLHRRPDGRAAGALLSRGPSRPATLRHPNICPIYDFGQIDGKHFISMAYIEGRPLSAFIQPDKPQTERQILIVVRKLALALQEAHDHGIVHRDLKPANIMVDKKGEPIIMDFGLAQQARGATRTSA